VDVSAEPRELRIEFATEEAFRGEYLSNIANGGIFVATRTPFEVRDQVRVEITLGFSGEKLEFEGEVVHRVPPELAETGATPGIAVQFATPASDIRRRLERLVGRIEETDERLSQSGRRRASRAPCRLSARIESGDQRLLGRTRNLSTTGTLVSVEGEPVAVGKVVQLMLTHPTTGEELELEGRVVRHLEDDEGEVTAVGIHFQTPEARREEVARFVVDVKAAEHSRRLGGISGAISEIGIANLLQMFGTCAAQGTLIANSGAQEGTIAFERGLLRLAQVGRRRAVPALAKILSWREGSFEFQSRIDSDQCRSEAPLPLDGAILEATRLLDEGDGAKAGAPRPPEEEAPAGARAELPDEGAIEELLAEEEFPEALCAEPRRFPLDARLAIDSQAVKALRQELGKTEEALLDLARVGMRVGKVLDVIPESPEEIFAVLSGLVDLGLVSIRE
jgi:type IV pilus assembly protein PilZ